MLTVEQLAALRLIVAEFRRLHRWEDDADPGSTLDLVHDAEAALVVLDAGRPVPDAVEERWTLAGAEDSSIPW